MSNAEMTKVKEETKELDHIKSSRLDDSLFSKDLAPHYMKLATQLAGSELVPKAFRNKPQDLFLCWAMGYSVGMSPEQSMQCIAIINGRACMYGDEMLALCMAHKDFEDINEEPIIKDNVIIGYTCTVKRKGKADKSNVFTLDMAKKAGLLAKGGVWLQYPERMLKLRARGFTLRDACPDILKGIKSREEVEDYITAEYKMDDSSDSRTQLLKRDFLEKKGAADAKNNVASIDTSTFNEDFNVKKKTTENNESLSLGNAGEQKTETLDSTELLSKINENQISRIYEMMNDKHFTEDRLNKALQYYEVKSIEDMSSDFAEHFINQLKKA
jgi:hypothetical protein